MTQQQPFACVSSQERAVRAVFDEAGTSPLAEPVGRWKASKKLATYPLPPDPSMAARLIGQVFRLGYGLDDLASITFFYHEIKTA